MKVWKVGYSIRKWTKDAVEITEHDTNIIAETIGVAVVQAEEKIRGPLLASHDPGDVVIWSVTMCDDDVF